MLELSDRSSLATLRPYAIMLALLSLMPAFAQTSHTSKSRVVPSSQHAQFSSNQLSNMLDQIETGKSPTLPAQSVHKNIAAQRSSAGLRVSGTNIPHRQPTLNSRVPMTMMGSGMHSMSYIGGRNNSPAFRGGGQSMFIQNLAQKISAMRQNGGGGQDQLLQQMIKGGSTAGAAGAAGRGFASHGPTGAGRPPHGLPDSGSGGVPVTHFAPGSLLRKGSTANGSASVAVPKGAAGGASDINSLERQMEKQYGR